MANLIQKLMGVSKGNAKDNCCGVEIKEIKEGETVDSCCETHQESSSSCCETSDKKGSCCN